MGRLPQLCALLLALCPAVGFAQNLGGPLSEGVIQSPILVIEFDRVFSESAFGKRIAEKLEADGAQIAAENRQIEAELTEEERSLTEKRETMDPAAFRELAAAFDEKVQRLRREQDAKARSLGQSSEEAQRRFLLLAQPVLESLMRESGAVLVLERRTVFVAADAVDITDTAIEQIDARVGDGSQTQPEGAVEAPKP